MSSTRRQAMEAYYNRDPVRLEQIVASIEAEAMHLRAYIAGHPAPAPSVAAQAAQPDHGIPLGPSTAALDTGRNEREIGPVDGPGNS